MFTDSKNFKSKQGGLSQQNTIAKGTIFEGDLKSEGDFRIEGIIKGALLTKGKVVIGSTGFIDGSLSCNNADIEGQVKGKIIVTDTLSLRSSANVNGDVQIGKLAVEPGAIFNAQCQMKNAVKELKSELKAKTGPSVKSEQSA